MVWRGCENVFAGIWNRADAHVDKRCARTASQAAITHVGKTLYEILSGGIVERVPWVWIVPMRSARIRAVRIRDPETAADAVLTVCVVPSRIDEHAVVVDGRIPFGGLEIAHRHDVRAVVLHRKERVVAHFDVIREAADVAAAPFGDEGDAAVRQPAWVEIVVCFVRQHPQVGTIDIDRENMPAGVAGEDVELVVAVGRPREGDPLAVV